MSEAFTITPVSGRGEFAHGLRVPAEGLRVERPSDLPEAALAAFDGDPRFAVAPVPPSPPKPSKGG